MKYARSRLKSIASGAARQLHRDFAKDRARLWRFQSARQKLILTQQLKATREHTNI